MAHHVAHTMQVNLPTSKVWTVLADFSGIERYNDKVAKSPLLPGVQSGVGAKRQCHFYDKSSVVEQIVEYYQGEGYRFELSEFSMPLKSAFATMKVVEVDANTSQLQMSLDYVVKGGPLGWLAGILLMRPMMKSMMKKTLAGLAYHAATGLVVKDKMPTQNELELALNN